ncbi:MAG TPA: GTPase HflX [Deltaproteobacteria bacterium]|nr:MAG: GTPase HflX [Deltaproteobacteria bacterium GWA2_55_82]OGQ63098.1 MAG: GTPase HflX [Deltaproteobacteria bacterium RIFCSPLOWO2_02_FULL_55_12]OIJ73557.1 MAG: GTPase HflX [Deltaproteobacteria bacterium GWC2_55_46]HBG47690.1 GTPase HflX [Deltaproteobacteria bacterium]HCY12088.1 GTPase HflX [Deltaproteobacteria bacterium]
MELFKEEVFRIAQVFGNLSGLKASQLKAIERIYTRKVTPSRVITPELGRSLTELSREIKRQLGIIVNRRGAIAAVIVGDEREIVIPVLSGYPLGRKHLRGVRCVHTHLKNEPLSQDDLTDLALLRLDLIAAIGVKEDGLPADIHIAHLLPYYPDGETYEVDQPKPFHALDIDAESFASSLEEEMGRAITRDVRDKRERAILVSVATRPREEQMESLEELKELARTDNVVVLDMACQRPEKLNPKYLMGTGKIKDLIIKALQKDATLLIFDQELTPTQIRELGEIMELKVIDRTQLILDIFARRAHSRDGKVQVELAQLKYLLPKLTGKGTSLSRLMGGIGGRGPGETKLEVDRRRVQDRITHLEKELKSLSRGRYERRRRRAGSGIPIISIVGYTNAGKSTLLNALTRSDTLVEDKLFATLDTASRRLRFPKERDTVITDTVGFIKDLPEDLFKAFKSTLEEMEDANLLMHVVDLSNPAFESRIKTVEDVLDDIGLKEIPRLLVFNKTDLMDPVVANNLARRYEAINISAIDSKSLAVLLKELEKRLWPGEALEKTAN